MPRNTDTDLLSAALTGYQHQKQTIEQRISDIRARLAGGAPSMTAAAGAAGPTIEGAAGAAMALEPTQPTKKRRRISLAGRKRIAAAQLLRWANKRAGAEVKAR